MDWQTRGLAGAYIMLAMWEYFHYVLALGFGRLRETTAAIFQRAAGFALAVPLLTMMGGVKAIWVGMCCSILFWSAWRLPKLLQTQVARVSEG
jgi:hypothetical protein